MVAAADVDRFGLTIAGRMAFAQAVARLCVPPDFLLIDAFTVPDVSLPQKALIFGDCISLSIASASVVAKVIRDGIMDDLDATFPGYGFGRHKGYGTRQHQLALTELGPCHEHRASYAPLRALGAAALSPGVSDAR
jgi:ribonuclease HII